MSDTGVSEPDTGEEEHEHDDNAPHVIFMFGCEEGSVQQVFHPSPKYFFLMYALAGALLGNSSIGIATSDDNEDPSEERLQEIFEKSLRNTKPDSGFSVMAVRSEDIEEAMGAPADGPGLYL